MKITSRIAAAALAVGILVPSTVAAAGVAPARPPTLPRGRVDTGTPVFRRHRGSPRHRLLALAGSRNLNALRVV